MANLCALNFIILSRFFFPFCFYSIVPIIYFVVGMQMCSKLLHMQEKGKIKIHSRGSNFLHFSLCVCVLCALGNVAVEESFTYYAKLKNCDESKQWYRMKNNGNCTNKLIWLVEKE